MKPIQWHKIVALLMHQFEIKEFTISEGDIEAFKNEYDGELPLVLSRDLGDRIKISLEDKDKERRIIQ